MRILWIEIRRSPLLWAIPVLLAVQLYGLYGRSQRWVGVWSQTSAAVQFGSFYLGIAMCAAAAWVAGRPVHERAQELLELTSRPPFLASALHLISVLLYGLVPFVVVTIAAAATSAGTPGAGFLWPSYLILGVTMVLAASSLGFIVGSVVSPKISPILAAASFFVLSVWIPSDTFRMPFAVLSGPPWLVVVPVALAARITVALMLFAIAVLLRSRRRGERVRHAWIRRNVATGVAAVLLVGALSWIAAAGPLQVERRPPSAAMCTEGTVHICFWPDSAKYLPAAQGMANRTVALNIPGLTVPASFRVYERGLQAGGDGFTDDFGEWGIAQYVAGRVVIDGQDATCPDLSSTQANRINTAWFEVQFWLTMRVAGGAPPSGLQGGPPIDQTAVERVVARDAGSQAAWVGERIALMTSICP